MIVAPRWGRRRTSQSGTLGKPCVVRTTSGAPSIPTLTTLAAIWGPKWLVPKNAPIPIQMRSVAIRFSLTLLLVITLLLLSRHNAPASHALNFALFHQIRAGRAASVNRARSPLPEFRLSPRSSDSWRLILVLAETVAIALKGRQYGGVYVSRTWDEQLLGRNGEELLLRRRRREW